MKFFRTRRRGGRRLGGKRSAEQEKNENGEIWETTRRKMLRFQRQKIALYVAEPPRNARVALAAILGQSDGGVAVNLLHLRSASFSRHDPHA
ncbi:MAG: hypothetical protein ABI233_07510 [Chthoniobacterales bacterium]